MSEPVLGIIPEQGGSIANLARSGQDRRFVDYYLRKYAAEFSRVIYFSYIQENLSLPNNCVVVSNPGFHRWLYAYFMPLIHYRKLKSCSVLRVMQAYGAIPAIVAKSLYRTPFVVTYGYPYFENAQINGMKLRPYLFKWRASAGAKHASRVIVTSQAMFEYVSEFVSPSKIVYSPNGVDTQAFSPAQLHPEPLVKTILYVGRLSPDKNIRVLIEAIDELNQNFNVRLLIVGDGPLKSDLEDQAVKTGAQIEFLGILPNHQLPEVYHTSDVFVLPSYGEGHPKALLEAMSCALPCIGTNVAGIRDLIRDGETGLLCGQTGTSIAEKLHTLLANPGLAARLGTSARHYVRENFDIHQIMAKEITMLKAVANQSNP
jgi:glycosyltransferase involved in cell wall biosynthesis